jgi:hypothetical protein
MHDRDQLETPRPIRRGADDPAAAQTSGKALWCLLFSIGNFLCLPFILSLPSVILGILAIVDINRRRLRGMGMAVTGIVLSVAGDIIYAVLLVVAVIVGIPVLALLAPLLIMLGMRNDLQKQLPQAADNVPQVQAMQPAVKDPEDARVYLTSLKPATVSQQAPLWNGGAAGQLGDGRLIEINGGQPVAKGLSIGPPNTPDQPMLIEYELPQELRPSILQMHVGLDDSSGPVEKPGIIFEVLGDGKALWTSRTIKRIREYEECRVKVDGVARLTLRYRSLDGANNQRWTLPVWIDPYLIAVARAGK